MTTRSDVALYHVRDYYTVVEQELQPDDPLVFAVVPLELQPDDPLVFAVVALELQPDDPFVFAVVALELQPDDPLFFAVVALELQPDDPLVFKRRADVLGKLGRRHDAIEDYRRAIEIESATKKIYVSGKTKMQKQVEQTWETV